MNRHKLTLAWIIPTAALLLAGLLWAFVPNRRQTRLDSICRVEAASWYVLHTATGDTLYFSLSPRGARSVACSPDSVSTKVDLSGVFVSGAGHVVTTDSLTGRRPDSLTAAEVRERLRQTDSALHVILPHHRAKLKELDEYATRHSVVDDGYNEVMAYRARTGREIQRLNRLYRRISRARKDSLRTARLESRVTVMPAANARRFEARRVGQRDGLILLGLESHLLPAGCSRFSVYLPGTYAYRAQLYAYQDFGGPTATSRPQAVTAGAELLPATEGGAWVNASGQLCGLQRKGKRVSSRTLAALVMDSQSLPLWWKTNLQAWIARLQSTAQPVAPRPTPEARRLTVGDSLCYEGQVTASARGEAVRHGWGRLIAQGDTVYEGRWQADTLESGVRRTAQSCYRGGFNARLQPEGWGTEERRQGEYYAGEWKNGQRNGHGMSVRPYQLVRCGDWRRDRFRGERMIYTADRIYGIDISRYQHGKGKKKYGIDWKQLRITSLGNGRRVQGNVDYPVSFVYIKSTEGRTIVNPYYANDLRQARKHGVAAGSYHFFSLKSTGAQQAAHFLRRSSVTRQDLPPVLDLEPSDAQIRQAGGDSAMFVQVLVWLRTVEKRCGKRPVLYVGQNFVDKHLPHAPAALKKYDVWIARYGQFKPYVRLLHWQLTPYGRVRGIHGDVDINVYNGTREQFADYLEQVRK